MKKYRPAPDAEDLEKRDALHARVRRLVGARRSPRATILETMAIVEFETEVKLVFVGEEKGFLTAKLSDLEAERLRDVLSLRFEV